MERAVVERRAVVSVSAELEESERRAGQLAGYVEEIVDGFELVKSQLSVAQAAAVYAAEAPGMEARARLVLSKWPDSVWARRFMETQKFVLNSTGDGYVRVPRISGLNTKSMSAYGEAGRKAVEDADRVLSAIRAKPKYLGAVTESRVAKSSEQRAVQYFLSQFFFDNDVVRKYSIDSAYMQIVKRIAASDANMASQMISKFLHESGHRVTVLPGDYATSSKRCKITLLEAARESKLDQVEYDSVVIGNTAVLWYTVRDQHHWAVKGPINFFSVLDAVYRMCVRSGPTLVDSTFALELATLRVNIEIQPRFESLYQLDIDMHVGTGQLSGSVIPSKLTQVERQIVMPASDKIRSVRKGDCIVATAVAVSATSSLVNWHVLSANDIPDLFIEDRSFTARVAVGMDLWIVEHDPLPFPSPWVVRPPRKTEPAVLVASGLRSQEFSSPITMVDITAGTLVTTLAPQMRPGISGAAVVSLEDGALLGVYVGVTRVNALASLIVQSNIDELYDVPRTPVTPVTWSDSAQVTTLADGVMQSFKERGLYDSVLQVVHSVMSLEYQGNYVTIGMVKNSRVYVTKDPEDWPMEYAGRQLTFDRSSDGRFVSLDVPSGHRGVENARGPVVNEVVVVLSSDGDGLVFSDPITVTRCDAGSEHFSCTGIGDTPYDFSGGVVIALSDAAVVGQFLARHQTYAGETARCALVESRNTVVDRVMKCFGTADIQAYPTAWNKTELTAVFDLREETVRDRYFMVGQAALQDAVIAAVSSENRQDLIDSVIQKIADPSFAAVQATRLQLSSVVDLVPGVALPLPPDIGAKLFYAVLGMMRVNELAETFEDAVSQLGLLDVSLYVESHRKVGFDRLVLSESLTRRSRSLDVAVRNRNSAVY